MDSHKKGPTHLYTETLKLAQMSLNPKPLLVKFFTLNLLGALATLIICPQYGFGPFGFETAFVNVIMSYGPVVCGIFCASIFFLGGHLLAYLFLSDLERKWVMKHEYALVIPYVSFIFMLGMGLKNIFPGHIHHDVFSYYGSWLVTAFGISILVLKTFNLQKRKYA